MQHASVAANTSIPWHVRTQAVQDVAQQAAAIAESAQSMLRREEAMLIPAVVRLSSASEQHAVNSQVLRHLGIMDARLHLVGMYEAIVDNHVERQLFQATIPTLPQKMIPRWKRLLYEPRTACGGGGGTALEKVVSPPNGSTGNNCD
jgi:hypothetical protein